MKKIFLIISVLFCSTHLFSQNKDRVLVTIDGKSYYTSEFKRVYEKNLDAVEDDNAKDVRANAELFINYKLKVKEAYRLQLDTMPSYIDEIEMYRNQLSAPYLQDSTFINQLVKDAYYRTKYEIKARHILIKLAQDATPQDTLKAFQKIKEIRKSIIDGKASFEEMAVEFSDDPSAKGDASRGIPRNEGDLGYFSAFKMVFAFEQAAYRTKINEISEPFRTRFGYHIVKVEDLRLSKGELEVAHILIGDKTQSGKKQIFELYDRLEKKEAFGLLARKYSEDMGSKSKGGKLRKFGTGKMVKPFEDAAFSLTKELEYSKPFLTRFGWHIVQLLKKYPVATFKDMRLSLRRQINSSSRMQLSKQVVVDRLKEKYVLEEAKDLKDFLSTQDLEKLQLDNKNEMLFSINGVEIGKSEFVAYVKNRRKAPLVRLYEEFQDEKILNYYKENLENSNAEFAYVMQEYRDGLLLFELMQQKIWKKATDDEEGLEKFYQEHKEQYAKPLAEMKGQVVSDYQEYIEKEWLSQLRAQSDIQLNEKSLKKLVKYYKKNG